MIKYKIKKIPYVEGFVMCNYEYQIVSKADLKKFLNQGWEIDRKEYFILSFMGDFWEGYNRDKKTDIILVIVSIICGWLLSKI